MTRPVTPKQRINHLIKVPEVRVIGAEGEQLGILKTAYTLLAECFWHSENL